MSRSLRLDVESLGSLFGDAVSSFGSVIAVVKSQSAGVRRVMSEWQSAETNNHQDHVIAHVIGATVEGWFTWDETVYLLLDIGFIWNVYLDLEMGLVPHPMAISEMNLSDEEKSELREDVDKLLRQSEVGVFAKMTPSRTRSPIQETEVLTLGDLRRLRISCEESTLVLETNLESAEVKVYEL